MTATARGSDVDLRPRSRHMAAASVAAALSILLHLLLWSELPGLPLPQARPPVQKPYHTIQMQDVRTIPPPRREDQGTTDRLRPENPQQLADLLGAPAPLPELATDSVRIPAPPDIRSPVSTMSPALSGPVSSPDRSRWEPRQEILQVEQRLVKDEAAALPRSIIPAAPRIDRAPDVVLPIDLPLGGNAGAASPRSTAASGYTLTSPTGVEGGVGPGSAAGGGSSRAQLFPGTTTLFDEKLTDLSSNRAVDAYLDLSMLLYRAPGEGGVGYFELQIRRQGEKSLPVLPKDVLFMQDCSESMTPWKLAECKEGLRRWLERLGPADRFDILSFRDTVSRCFNRWMPVTEASRQQGLAYVDNMRAVGYTDVYASLEAARQVRDDAHRPVIAILVTDGRPTAGVIGSSDIIEGFTRQNQGWVSVFSVGGGKKVNRFLIDLLSYRNRGESLVVPEEKDIPAALQRWSVELDRPVLSDLNYRVSGYDASQIFPQTLTHLFLDRPLVIYGRIAAGERKAAIQILGRAGTQSLDMMFPLDAAQAQPGDPVLRERWAWQKVYSLIGEYIQTQRPALLQEIHAHARQYGLNVPYGYGEGVPMD